jgi:hypothetical protein
MADLGVRISLSMARAQIMPASPTLVQNLNPPERFRIAEAMTVAMGLLVNVDSEILQATAGTVSRIMDAALAGEVAFNASPDHEIVTNYTANVRVSGSSTVVATQSLGKPTPDGNGVIIVDLTSTFAGLSTGTYTVSILATAPAGSADSAESAAFSLPLA